MSAPHADAILGGYRRRLDEELRQLPRSRREEIIAEVEAHIRDARAAYPAETDADLLNLLDRLGDPGIIGAEARDRFDVVEPAPVGTRETIALLLLLAGPFVIPVVRGILGGLLVRSSVSWTARQKRNAIRLVARDDLGSAAGPHRPRQRHRSREQQQVRGGHRCHRVVPRALCGHAHPGGCLPHAGVGAGTPRTATKDQAGCPTRGLGSTPRGEGKSAMPISRSHPPPGTRRAEPPVSDCSRGELNSILAM